MNFTFKYQPIKISRKSIKNKACKKNLKWRKPATERFGLMNANCLFLIFPPLT